MLTFIEAPDGIAGVGALPLRPYTFPYNPPGDVVQERPHEGLRQGRVLRQLPRNRLLEHVIRLGVYADGYLLVAGVFQGRFEPWAIDRLGYLDVAAAERREYRARQRVRGPGIDPRNVERRPRGTLGTRESPRRRPSVLTIQEAGGLFEGLRGPLFDSASLSPPTVVGILWKRLPRR